MVRDIESCGGLSEGSTCCAQFVGLGSKDVSFGFGPCRFLAGSKAPLRYEVRAMELAVVPVRDGFGLAVLDRSGMDHAVDKDHDLDPGALVPLGQVVYDISLAAL